MAMEVDTSTKEEVQSTDGSWLKVGGTYHFAVIDADEQPVWRGGENKGQPMDGFEIEAEVMAGPEAKKTHRFFVRNPSASHKDGGKFCRTVRTRVLEAVGLIDPSHYGQRVTIELVRQTPDGPQVVPAARQFTATLKANEKGYLDLDGAKIWHIDDPHSDKCERNQAAIGLIPKEHRRDPASFEKPKSDAVAGNGNGSGSSGSGQKQTAAAASTVNLDDL